MNSRTTIKAMKNAESLKPFLAIRTEQEYDTAVDRLNALVDEVGDQPKDPRYRLVETLGVLIAAYDRAHYALPEASGVDILRFLMQEHGLTQKDLPDIGSQGVVSEVLPAPPGTQRAPNPSARRTLRRLSGGVYQGEHGCTHPAPAPRA